MNSDLLSAAQRGWKIFPLLHNSHFAVRQPLLHHATSNKAEIEHRENQYPGCNWALATGKESGVFAIKFSLDTGLATMREFGERLELEDPSLWQAWRRALRESDCEAALVRSAGRFPLCGRGDINLYAVFAEVFLTLLDDNGRSGSILPCGIATDDTTKNYFQYIVDSRRLNALFGLINEQMLFPSVLHNFKFCLLILGGKQCTTEQATIVFNCHNIEQTREEERRFSVTREEIALVNPNTRTCPTFFWRDSAEITKAIYRRVPVLSRDEIDNDWALALGTIFHSSNDSDLFQSAPSETRVALYEAKMFDQFNHRFGSYDRLLEGEPHYHSSKSSTRRFFSTRSRPPYTSTVTNKTATWLGDT